MYRNCRTGRFENSLEINLILSEFPKISQEENLVAQEAEGMTSVSQPNLCKLKPQSNLESKY